MPPKDLSDRLAKLGLEDEGDDEFEDGLVIGIDFGTTYSGAAWATRIDFENNQVNFITSWPGNGREEGKVPTELWYEADEPVWGYEIPADGNPFRWFKLLLLRSEDLSPELRDSAFVVRARNMLEESGRTVESLISDYLRLLWEHIMSTIEKARGETVVEALAIHVVITVPAIWKIYARQTMENAAKAAGILNYRVAGATKLTFAPEPEVAALSALLEQGSGVRPGNVYVICDAGGGTVDLISYKVASIKPIILEEAVEGTGGLCGGIFIDQAFEAMCKGRLESKWKRLSRTGMREIMKSQWEYGIKPQFKSAQTKKEYIVSLPAEVFKGQSISSLDDTSREPCIKNGRIHFHGKHVERAFMAVTADIGDLGNAQIQKTAKMGLVVTGIVLVGGLGGSPYLYEYLKALHSKAGVAVLQSSGIKPRTAICRGAVFKGFLEEEGEQQLNAPIMVASTISRASYGIKFRTTFYPYFHSEEDKVWDEHEGEYKAENQMNWYLERGDMVSKIKPRRRSWYRLYAKKDFRGILATRLYQCEDEKPPERLTSSVRTLCTLNCDLDVQYSDLPDFESKTGVTLKKLECEIELVPSGASVEFILFVGGRKQGSEKAKIQFV